MEKEFYQHYNSEVYMEGFNENKMKTYKKLLVVAVGKNKNRKKKENDKKKKNKKKN